MQSPKTKAVTAYCVPWSLRAGESVALHASSHQPGPAKLDLVRLYCGDPTKAGPGFNEEVIAVSLPEDVTLTDQPLVPGSWGEIPLGEFAARNRVELRLSLRATRPLETQTVVSLGDIAVRVHDGALVIARGDAAITVRDRALDARRWYALALDLDCLTGRITAELRTETSASPGRDAGELSPDHASLTTVAGPFTPGALLLATDADKGDRFDGRLGALALSLDDTALSWDLAQQMDSPTIVDTSGHGLHGRLHQLPARAVTGPTWNGSEQRWRDAPRQWDAVHFHSDDLYDAAWAETATLRLPDDLASGIYCFRISQDDEIDRVPFFVRPAIGGRTADVALLMSTATYQAYANHRQLIDGADFIASRNRLRPEHEYVREHPDVGFSMYEKHLDGSGVMFSSRLRPVLNLRPGADGWNFTPDTDINAWLEQTGIGHDIIADEDLHADGLAALDPYRVVVTCSHPEYWSTAMLDALSSWQRRGGRLMYLGGNGFYWRVAFSQQWPGAIELRRAEDGVRNWQTEDGENYHAFGGEYGGMWRRNGRPPNEIAGIGFAAQGFERATYYKVNAESVQSRAAWIWNGIDTDKGRIGTSGLGGGAAGQEVDRFDTRLGSPQHAVVLASATDFGPDMVRTKEEFEASVQYRTPDPYVRADIVFYETAGGGAVFSVGSIAWFGAMARNGYDNDVARMTSNVLHRFADPAPFEPPFKSAPGPPPC